MTVLKVTQQELVSFFMCALLPVLQYSNQIDGSKLIPMVMFHAVATVPEVSLQVSLH